MESLDFQKLSDLGGVFVISLLLMKIIWNDLKHLNASAERMEGRLLEIQTHAKESKDLLQQLVNLHKQ